MRLRHVKYSKNTGSFRLVPVINVLGSDILIMMMWLSVRFIPWGKTGKSKFLPF